MLLNLEIKLEGLAKCIRRVQTKLLERSLPMIKILKKGVLKQYPFFIHVGGERPCKGKVSCPRMQHNVPSQESNSTTQSRDKPTIHEVTGAPTFCRSSLLFPSTREKKNTIQKLSSCLQKLAGQWSK